MLLCSIQPNLAISKQPSIDMIRAMVEQINDARQLYLDGYITHDDYIAIHNRMIAIIYG